MTWITPFVAAMSVVTTCAPFTNTLPSRTTMSSGRRLTLVGEDVVDGLENAPEAFIGICGVTTLASS